MKCGRLGCNYQAKTDRRYCSPDCVRLDQDSVDSNIKLVKAEPSSIKANGESSVQSWPEENDNPRNMGKNIAVNQALNRQKLIDSGIIIPEEGITTPNENGLSIHSSQLSRNPSFGNEEDRGADGLIQLMGSLTPSPNIVQEKSHSMNLIDKSASHLHELMRSVAPVPNDGNDIDLDKVKTACVCAKEMAQLIRLKLDILKEFRKI